MELHQSSSELLGDVTMMPPQCIDLWYLTIPDSGWDSAKLSQPQHDHIHSLGQDCCNSIANALEQCLI